VAIQATTMRLTTKHSRLNVSIVKATTMQLTEGALNTKTQAALKLCAVQRMNYADAVKQVKSTRNQTTIKTSTRPRAHTNSDVFERLSHPRTYTKLALHPSGNRSSSNSSNYNSSSRNSNDGDADDLIIRHDRIDSH